MILGNGRGWVWFDAGIHFSEGRPWDGCEQTGWDKCFVLYFTGKEKLGRLLSKGKDQENMCFSKIFPGRNWRVIGGGVKLHYNQVTARD